MSKYLGLAESRSVFFAKFPAVAGSTASQNQDDTGRLILNDGKLLRARAVIRLSGSDKPDTVRNVGGCAATALE